MNIKGVGIDIAQISRFKKIGGKTSSRFLEKNFSIREQSYIFSYKDWATHMAGTFAAKESVVKAMGGKGVSIPLIEIVRDSTGKPEVYIKGRKSKNVLTTISHSGKVAIAFSIHI